MNLLGTEDEVAGLTEMTIVLLQVGSITAVACLRALLRHPERQRTLLRIVTAALEPVGDSLGEWYSRLGLH